MNTQALQLKEKMDIIYYGKEEIPIYYELGLPIKKIKKMAVCASLKFYRNSIDFVIDSGRICCNNINEGETVRLYHKTIFKGRPNLIEDYIEILNNMKDIMKKLKLNKFVGRFETEPTTIDIDWKEIFNEEEYDIEFSFGMCCVCHESTKTMTEGCCKKPLCYECWDKLPLDMCETCTENPGECCEGTDTCGTAKCPLCRCSLQSGCEFDY